MFLLLKFLLLVVPSLVSVAFLTLMERKLLSLIGLRVGPNKVSFSGFLQPVGDALKLSNKSVNYLGNFSYIFYYASSFLMIMSSLMLFCSLYTFPSIVFFKYSVLIFFLILGLNSLNSMISGWSTFTKYSLVGSLRTISQLVSYEAVLYVCIFSIVITFCTFDFSNFSFYSLFFSMLVILPCSFVWFPTFLAELNRTPYDFSEGESELVSGFNVEFGSLSFTLIFLAEYANIVFFSILTSFLFFPGSLFIFLVMFFVVWIRSVLPRFRFDKLMDLAWKFFIPFLTFYFLLIYICLF